MHCGVVTGLGFFTTAACILLVWHYLMMSLQGVDNIPNVQFIARIVAGPESLQALNLTHIAALGAILSVATLIGVLDTALENMTTFLARDVLRVDLSLICELGSYEKALERAGAGMT